MVRMAAKFALAFAVLVMTSCTKNEEEPVASPNGSSSGNSAATNVPTSPSPPAMGTSASHAESADSNLTAEQILRGMTEFYQQAQSVQVDVAATIHIKAPGIDNRMRSNRKLAAVKPNRLSIESDGTLNGVNAVMDGETLSLHIVALNRYEQSESPKSFDELMANPVAIMIDDNGMGGSVMLSLLTSNSYDQLMEGVNSAKYVGKTTIDGASVHHLRFTQEQLDWEAWIGTGEQPRASAHFGKPW